MEEDLALVVLVYVSVIAAAGVGLFLVFLLYRSRRQISALRRQQARLRKRLTAIPQYLRRELQATRKRLADAGDIDRPDHPALPAWLRGQYLVAERRALVANGRQTSQLNQLESDMHKVLASLYRRIGVDELQRLRDEMKTLQAGGPGKAGTAQAMPAADFAGEIENTWLLQLQASEARIQEMLQVVSEHQDTIAQLRRQLREYKLKGDGQSGETERNLEAMLDESDANTNEMQRRIGILQSELQEARATCTELKERLKAQGKPQRREMLIVSKSRDGDDKRSSRQMLREVGETYERKQQELKRLRERNLRQRELIMKMERELSNLRGHEGEYSKTATLIDRLKLQLRDSELCTAVLESQVDELRAQLQQLQASAEAQHQAGDSGREGDGGSDQQQAEYRQRVIHFVSSVARTAEREQLAELIVEFLGDRFKMHAQFRGSGGMHWFGSSGVVGDSTRRLLNGLIPDPKHPWVELKDGDALVLKNSRYLFVDMGDEPGAATEIHELLLNALLVADAAVARIDSRDLINKQRYALKRLVEEARTGINSIEIQRKYLIDEARKAADTFRDELDEFVDGVALSQVQREVFNEMVADFEQRISLLFESGAVVSRSSGELIDKLEQGQKSN